MLARDDLEIKIIMPKHGDGTILSKDELENHEQIFQLMKGRNL